jgi:hypothetical protein
MYGWKMEIQVATASYTEAHKDMEKRAEQSKITSAMHSAVFNLSDIFQPGMPMSFQ